MRSKKDNRSFSPHLLITMKKCPRCNTRKSKRYCPALGKSLCTLCCGQIREKEVHCPADCPFLSKHKSYQEKRIIEKKSTHRRIPYSEEELLKDERMAWLAFNIEAPLKEYAEQRPSLNDREALLALEYAREKIAKGRGLVIMPEKSGKPRNELGDAIYQMIERCRYEGRIIVAGKPQAYSTEEKLKVCAKLIGTLKQLAQGNLEGRSYIRVVLERFAQMDDQSRRNKVFTIT